MNKYQIRNITSRQVWGSDQEVAIEIEIQLRYGASGSAVAALDKEEFARKSPITKIIDLKTFHPAIDFIQKQVSKAIKGKYANEQNKIDEALSRLVESETSTKSVLSILAATSLANLAAIASAEQMPIWHYLSGYLLLSPGRTLPVPQIEILDAAPLEAYFPTVPSFFLIPIGADSYLEALFNSAAVLKAFKAQETSMNSISLEDSLRNITTAIEKAGFSPGKNMAISMDVGFKKCSHKFSYVISDEKKGITSDDMCGILVDCIERFPVFSVQDPFYQNDKDGWMHFHWAVAKRVQTIKSTKLTMGSISESTQNTDTFYDSQLIEFPRSLTITDLTLFSNKDKLGGSKIILSSRFSHQNHASIIHLSVGLGLDQIRLSSLRAGNEGIRITDQMRRLNTLQLPEDGALPSSSAFPWG